MKTVAHNKKTAAHNKKLAKNAIGFLLSLVATALLMIITVAVAVGGASVSTISTFAGMTVAGGLIAYYFDSKLTQLNAS